MKLRRKHFVVAALFGVLSLAACAARPVHDSPENIVRQRATAHLEAFIARDFQKAYQFLQPSYRAVRDFESYRRTVEGGMAQRTGGEVTNVECKPDVCIAKIRMEFKITQKGYGDALVTGYDERWIMEQGSWWLYKRP